MKRILVSPLFFLLPMMGFSQLYVSPNSYMYVNNQVVFVTQDINLQNNGNLYLRNESQLIQGTAGASTNKGLGKVSMFQEGTSDNYDYNYWCSPVGNASASAGNENFGITMLNRPTGLTAYTPATILSASALDGIASPLSIAPRWIYKFLSSSTYSQWFLAGSGTTIAAGEGFTMKGTSGTDATTVNSVQNNSGSAQRYDFRGKPNDGNISVSVGLNNLTLTGNPYPSALHVNAFLLDASNSASTGIAYYWEQNKATNSHFLTQYQGGYGTYSPISLASNGIYVPATFNTYDANGNQNTTGTSSGLVIERKYAPIGQGFLVKGAASGTLTLKNSHRVYYKESGALSQFERTSSANATSSEGDVPHLKLNTILNNQHTRQLALAFVPEATDGVDRGIDAVSPADISLPDDVYFLIDDEKYVIEGVSFDVNKRIRLGVRSANNSTFSFHVPSLVNFDVDRVYLFDALDNSYHDIKDGSYELVLGQGVYDNRFEITFLASSLGVDSPALNPISMVQDNDQQLLTIANPSAVEIESCMLYDVSGKKILDRNGIGTAPYLAISTEALSTGIYIVKVTAAGAKQFSKKISVYKRL
jgi:uncharacterized protein YegP (UPF0339 family)